MIATSSTQKPPEPSKTNRKRSQTKSKLDHNMTKQVKKKQAKGRYKEHLKDEDDASSGDISGGSSDAGLQAYLDSLKEAPQKITGSPYSAQANLDYIKAAAENNRFGLLDADGNKLSAKDLQAYLKKNKPEFYAIVKRDLLDVKAASFIVNEAKAAQNVSNADFKENMDSTFDETVDQEADSGPKLSS